MERHEVLKTSFSADMATHFCACSHMAADFLFGPQIRRDNIRILNNAVNVDAYSFDANERASVRDRLRLKDKQVLCYVARFTYAKNHSFLMDVFARISAILPDARLLLIGDGPLREPTEALTAKYGLARKVMFLGKRDDVPSLFQAADVYLHPSLFEGLALTLVEAQTAGLKCLAGENLTRETKITPNLSFLPYDAAAWACAAVGLAAGYDRRDCSDVVSRAGYSLREYIREIEEIYADNDAGRNCKDSWLSTDTMWWQCAELLRFEYIRNKIRTFPASCS